MQAEWVAWDDLAEHTPAEPDICKGSQPKEEVSSSKVIASSSAAPCGSVSLSLLLWGWSSRGYAGPSGLWQDQETNWSSFSIFHFLVDYGKTFDYLDK